jgi:phosphohistidine phosphatase SixA
MKTNIQNNKILFGLIVLIILPIWATSIIQIYEDRSKIQDKISSVVIDGEDERNTNEDDNGKCYSEKSCVDEHAYWAQEIMKGGYILHFRHAERDKWIDVHMYDVLESDVHDKGINQSRLAENEYFKDAVCLNERGEIQSRAMGEHLENIKFPVGYVISSPICRSRQTAELAFGGYDDLDRTLVHRGAHREDPNQHISNLRELFLNLPIKSGKNTLVSSHNSVIHLDMFDESVLKTDQFELEEGGFYVISNNDGVLTLEHSFYYFRDFIINFYPRG